jgi:exonuclease III
MRVLSWNVNRSTHKKDTWGIFEEYNPDIALLQEVISIPEELKKSYRIISRRAINKSGLKQHFKIVNHLISYQL